jgi:glucose/mannose-6-phosphate isomerase
MIIDKQNMRQIIIDSPNQLKAGLELANNIKTAGDFKNVIICGIGGSALPASILISVIKPVVPVYIHRDYGLPEWADGQSLIICISYSGNTEEGVSSLQEAINKDLKVICIATGGKFLEICQQNKIPMAKIPSGIQPRSATGYLFSALVKVLINCSVIKDIAFDVSNLAEELKDIISDAEKEGKKLAKKIEKKIPLVYASNNFKVVARIWKIKFNENSKIPAFYNCFPELNHNELVGYSGIKKMGAKHFSVIILQDSADHPRVLKRMKLTANLIKNSGVKVEFVKIKTGSLMFKIFSTLLLGDWVSYYVALNQKIDPTPVKIIEDFKKQMSK